LLEGHKLREVRTSKVPTKQTNSIAILANGKLKLCLAIALAMVSVQYRQSTTDGTARSIFFVHTRQLHILLLLLFDCLTLL